MRSAKLYEPISRKWFQWVHNNNLIYNQCWEDPRLDRIALKITPFDSIAMITSAGCNALDYALDTPKKIYAIDMNPRQTALLDLKIAGIHALDYDDFFLLFGKGQHPQIRDLYSNKLRPLLSEASQKVWDENWSYFLPKRMGQGLYYRGSSGFAAWLVNHYLQFKKLRHLVFDIFETNSIEEQKIVYEKINAKLWSRGLEHVIDSDVGMSLLGVPRAQRKYIEKTYRGSVTSFVKECLNKVFSGLPIKDNYFWWLYLAGSYTEERCPEYLKEPNFLKLKKGLVNCIETHTDSFASFLDHCSEPISRFVLLDHMDWLADTMPDELAHEWRSISASAVPNARIIFRSGGSEVNFLDDIEVPTKKGNVSLKAALRFDADLATKLHAQDRVHTYGCFYIADWAY